jgi:hypothetical protein
MTIRQAIVKYKLVINGCYLNQERDNHLSGLNTELANRSWIFLMIKGFNYTEKSKSKIETLLDSLVIRYEWE